MPTSHVLAVCAPALIATTEGNGCIAQVTLQLNLSALMPHFRANVKSWAFLPSAFLPHRYRIFQPSTQPAMSWMTKNQCGGCWSSFYGKSEVNGPCYHLGNASHRSQSCRPPFLQVIRAGERAFFPPSAPGRRCSVVFP